MTRLVCSTLTLIRASPAGSPVTIVIDTIQRCYFFWSTYLCINCLGILRLLQLTFHAKYVVFWQWKEHFQEQYKSWTLNK
jgi:hypothetical protein